MKENQQNVCGCVRDDMKMVRLIKENAIDGERHREMICCCNPRKKSTAIEGRKRSCDAFQKLIEVVKSAKKFFFTCSQKNVVKLFMMLRLKGTKANRATWLA